MPLRPSVLLDRLRRPAYTGDDRCLPCTLVNLLIAVVVAGAVSHVSTVAAVLCLAVSLLLVSFRGYLIPGTPRLTARYVPARVLRAFDKQSSSADAIGDASGPERLNTAENVSDVDPDAVLVSAGVLEHRAGTDELSLASEFDARWESRLGATAGEPDRQREALERILGGSEASVSFLETEQGVIADADGTWVGTWPSRAALAADVAAEPLLRDAVDGWSGFDAGTRGTLLQGLRSFARSCPSCAGTITKDTEYRSISCCRSVEYGRHRCEECGATILDRDVSARSGGT